MLSPVLTLDGHGFDKSSIEEWFYTGKKTSPLTGLKLEDTRLIPNLPLKRLI
jgi:hypothetical protein